MVTIQRANTYFAYGNYKNVHIADYRTMVSPENVEEITSHFEDMAKTMPGEKLVTIMISEPTVGWPGSDLKDKASECVRRTSALTPHQAAVILGSGFWSGPATAMITLLGPIIRRCGFSVFASTRDAARWAATILEDPREFDGVYAALEKMRLSA